MYYYFKNPVHRNIHIYTHNMCDEKCTCDRGIYIIAFQTNWTNNWYYLNDKNLLSEMQYATKAKRFNDLREAYDFMHQMFSNLEYQGVDKIEA
jgi:hypothetical protein